jgi:hypothetical protein
MTTQPLDPQAYGLSEYQASLLREVFLDRPMEERARAIRYINDADPRLQRNREQR